jgi:hypothetical protein
MIRRLLLITKPVRFSWHRFTYRKFADVSCMSKLRNKYQNKPLLIVGSGPSLNQTPLDDFLKVPSIGMNKIDLLFPKVKWRPALIICINNLVVRQHRQNFVKSEIPVFLSWKCRSFVKRRDRKSLNYFLSLPQREFSHDLREGAGSSGTVTYAALQFAYFMGANPVILFGIDHSFTFEGTANQYVRRKGKDVNHFDPNYFKEGSYWGLPNLESSEFGYMQAKQAFEKDGRNVYDATINGKLHIFPKITVDQAKKYCGITS